MIALRLAVALVLAFLPASAMAAPAMHVLHITDTQAQTIAPSTQLEIRLPAMLGSGFSWSMTPLAGSVLKPGQQGSMARGPNDPNLDGSPDVQFFCFTAVHAGSETLTFDYRQPFDRKAPPSKAYRVTITVK